MIGFEGPWSTVQVARNLDNPVHPDTTAGNRSPYWRCSADSSGFGTYLFKIWLLNNKRYIFRRPNL